MQILQWDRDLRGAEQGVRLDIAKRDIRYCASPGGRAQVWLDYWLSEKITLTLDFVQEFYTHINQVTAHRYASKGGFLPRLKTDDGIGKRKERHDLKYAFA